MLAACYRKECVEFCWVLPCQVKGVIYEPSAVRGVENLQKEFHAVFMPGRPYFEILIFFFW